MIGIIVLLALSWALLKFLFKRKLSVIGIPPDKNRLAELFKCFACTLVLCALTQLLELKFSHASWRLNSDFNGSVLLRSLFWDFRSVLTEELVFRGALLYALIRKLGDRKAVILSAILFGIYHWFSMGVFGNILAMIIIFTGTGLMGYVWAIAFAKSRSMLPAFGLHLGWNVTFNSLFSRGPLGEVLLVTEHAQEITGWWSLVNLLSWLVLVPLLSHAFVKHFVADEAVSKWQ